MQKLVDILIQLLSFGTYSASQAALYSASAAYEASRVAKNSAGNFFGVVGYNSSAADQFIQVHNAAALPADGTAPVFTFKVKAQDNFSLDIGDVPVNFPNGVVVCNSSTANTKTIGAADCWFTVKYN